MDDINRLLNGLTGIAIISVKLQGAQLFFNQISHEAIHRTAGGRYSLQLSPAIGICDKRALYGCDLPLDAPKLGNDALISILENRRISLHRLTPLPPQRRTSSDLRHSPR
jgi:hypothetical protein